MRSLRILALLATIIVVGEARAAVTSAIKWRLDPSQSSLHVKVHKKGALAKHDHDFVPAKWQGTLEVDPKHLQDAKGSIEIDANSLRDKQPQLSDGDREKVERQ